MRKPYNFPVNVWVQAHTKVLLKVKMHFPPFKQGDEAHGSKTSQLTPIQFVSQTQLYLKIKISRNH